MKKALLILIPLIALAVFMSRPRALPATNDQVTTATENVVPEVKPVVQSEEASLSLSPTSVEQGDPVLVTLENVPSSSVKSLIFNKQSVPTFENGGKTQALLGLELRMTAGTYPLKLILTSGEVVSKDVVVGKKLIVSAPLGIPESLGGNSTSSTQQLLTTLADEGAIINAVPTTGRKLWSGTFRLPLNPPITITDTYGYSRETGGSTLAHKGTDYRASVGTPVYAMNSGKVAYVSYLRNYGNVIILDHGLGLQTIYMHLSEVLVKQGESVEKSELIAKSGDTGYVLGPHLHLSVKINHISIDPVKFIALLGE